MDLYILRSILLIGFIMTIANLAASPATSYPEFEIILFLDARKVYR